MKFFGSLLVFFAAFHALAEDITIAAAADLRLALPELIDAYRLTHPEDNLKVIYGSSGKLTTQIINGAPYDLFFSANTDFPERLYKQGFGAMPPEVYAAGRIVLWSRQLAASALTLEDLPNEPKIRRFAIANFKVAPYGMRAKEALEHAGVWEALQAKIVLGENVGQTAQMIESEAAEAGIIALSLTFFPSMQGYGYYLIPESYHQPLTQSYLITKHAENKAAARRFIAFMKSPQGRAIKEKYGFVVPAPAP